METRQLGKNGPEITTVGFGAWAIGGGDWAFAWGPQDDKDSLAALNEAMDLGINWIDTAAVYGLGHSEEVVGQAVKGRDDVMVFTKGVLRWNERGSVYKDHAEASVTEEIDASLKRLGVERIDLYQIHWPGKDDDSVRTAWTAIKKAIDAGKIRWGGVSNFNVHQLKIAQEIHPVTSLQPPYSMLRRDVEDELLPFCQEQGIGVICYSPMESGLLTGKYTRESVAKMADSDWRKEKSQFFQEPQFTHNLELIDGLKPIAEKHGKTLPQLAVAWTLRRPELTAAIVGARRPGQITETAGASGWSLPDEDIAAIEALLDTRKAALAAEKTD